MTSLQGRRASFLSSAQPAPGEERTESLPLDALPRHTPRGSTVLHTPNLVPLGAEEGVREAPRAVVLEPSPPC